MTPVHPEGRAQLPGRDRERDLLREHLDAVRAGEGSTVLINGAAGIGKTALVDDLATTARELGLLLLHGSGHDLTTPQPYALWVEGVSGLARLQAGDQAAPVAPPEILAAMTGAAAGGSQAQLFDAALQYFQDLSRSRPLLIVLEDLHWADRESLDLFRVVARRLRGQPALLVGTYRPGELEPQAWLARLIPHLVRESRARQIDLGPLDEGAVGHLLASRYDLDAGERQRLARYLFRHAEGNPLFTIELLRGLESSRRLRHGPAGWTLEELEPLPLPIFLRQVIDERLLRLPPPVRERLAVAAIIGNEFPLELWDASCKLSEDELLATLEQSIQAGLLISLDGGQRARFAHPLFHRALYESVLPPRRTTLHREIGERLAETSAPDPDNVAWHFRAAGDQRAAEWLIRAGERAQRAYAWRAAAERMRAAEELVAGRSSGAELGWLRYRIGRLLRHSDPAAAIQKLRQAEQLGVWSRDPALTAYARFDLGHTEVLGGEFARGLERMLSGDALLDRLTAEDDDAAIAAWVSDVLPDAPAGSALQLSPGRQSRVNPRRGTLVQWLVEPGRYDEAWELGSGYREQVERMRAPTAQHISSEGDTWYALGRIHAAMGRPEEAGRAFARAIDCYERIDHYLLVGATSRALLGEVVIPYYPDRLEERRRLAGQAEAAHGKAAGALSVQLTAAFAAAELLLVEGEWSRAREVLSPVAERGATIASIRLNAGAQLGWLAYQQGRTDEARQRVRQALPAGPETEPGDTGFVPSVELIQVAIDLALNAGDDELAGAWLATLERWLDWSGTTRWQATVVFERARIVAFRGDIERAREHATAAEELAGNPRQPLLQVAIRRLLGELAARQEDRDTVRRHLEATLELARACAAPYELALTELALAELLTSGAEQEDASRYLASARVTFERLEAAPSLERVDRLRASSEEPQRPGQSTFGLSNREREVLRLVAAGMTDAEVAEELSISYRTVTTHLTSIFNKLGVNSRVLATRFALENDLL